MLVRAADNLGTSVSPRSSGDRAVASEAMRAGSNLAGGTVVIAMALRQWHSVSGT